MKQSMPVFSWSELWTNASATQSLHTSERLLPHASDFFFFFWYKSQRWVREEQPGQKELKAIQTTLKSQNPSETGQWGFAD